VKWTIDTVCSGVGFVVRYMGISSIEGRFTHVRGTIKTTDDGQLKVIEAFIPARSVNTGVSERDTHLPRIF
jgi:polyisoprenoid-binding protein YceI